MTGSLSLLVLISFVFFIFPISLWKAGYDFQFPLRSHKFSFPTELVKFYIPYLVIFFIAVGIFTCFGFEPNWELFDHALFPHLKNLSPISMREILNLQTILFFILLYSLSFAAGFGCGKLDNYRIARAISNGFDLFAISNVKLVGLWGALFNSGRTPQVHLDVLTVGDILYSGMLYHYEVNDENLVGLALKQTKRFLVPLNEVKGNDESKYNIPGKVTYFNGAQIKNINIRLVEREDDNLLILGKNFSIDDQELQKMIDAAFKNVKQ